MKPNEVPEEAQAALQQIVDSGQAEWYLSGGTEKIEFTAIGFCIWYAANRAEHEKHVRAKVAEEILADVAHLFAARVGADLWEAAFHSACVARGGTS